MSKNLTTPPTAAELDAFLKRARTQRPPRLTFAIDATASRELSWALARDLQAQMFEEAARLDGLEVQLIYYRGELHTRECRHSQWTSDASDLARLMSEIACSAGRTQIARALRHVREEAETSGSGVLVFIGDAVEEEADELAAIAGDLGTLGVRCLMFQEGIDLKTEGVFRAIARITGGAYARFDVSAPDTLAALLRAAATYASGGTAALQRLAAREPAARALLTAIK
jgi:hypothetical protein